VRKKIFEHDLIDFPKLERVSKDGKRYYILPNGELAISVTAALDQATDKTYLKEWKARIGETEAQKISTQAANRGTALHSICENYLLNEEGYPEGAMPANIFSFKQIRPYIDRYIGKVYGIESRLYSMALKAAGTADCIAQWDGIPSIIDFKTSRKIKQENWIQNYFLQSTTYAMMVEELTDMKVPQIVIMIAVDGEDPQIFIKNKFQYTDQVNEIFSKIT
jgi:ATP-dependent exoDNAse (exonuclease V) beta subunit